MLCLPVPAEVIKAAKISRYAQPMRSYKYMAQIIKAIQTQASPGQISSYAKTIDSSQRVIIIFMQSHTGTSHRFRFAVLPVEIPNLSAKHSRQRSSGCMLLGDGSALTIMQPFSVLLQP